MPPEERQVLLYRLSPISQCARKRLDDFVAQQSADEGDSAAENWKNLSRNRQVVARLKNVHALSGNIYFSAERRVPATEADLSCEATAYTHALYAPENGILAVTSNKLSLHAREMMDCVCLSVDGEVWKGECVPMLRAAASLNMSVGMQETVQWSCEAARASAVNNGMQEWALLDTVAEMEGKPNIPLRFKLECAGPKPSFKQRFITFIRRIYRFFNRKKADEKVSGIMDDTNAGMKSMQESLFLHTIDTERTPLDEAMQKVIESTQK